MSILVHACCGDCLLKLLHSLEKEKFFAKTESAIFFYNPNIYPQEEYQARLRAVKTITAEQQIKLIVPNYKPQNYFTEINKNAKKKSDNQKEIDESFYLPNKLERCPKCWQLRLNELFSYAKDHDFTMVSSTLLSSSYQDQAKIGQIAQSLSRTYKIDFYQPKNIDYYLPTSGFYKQNFCGCLYSLLEKSREKYKL